MQNKILFTGCSYSCGNPSFPHEFSLLVYDKTLGDHSKVKSYAYPGQSNNLILKKIYDAINQEDYNNSLFICQLTFLHRTGGYHDIINSWVDYQPEFINSIPMINESSDELKFPFHIDFIKNVIQSSYGKIDNNIPDDILNELKVSYETYLKYVFNEHESFMYLMYQIDVLNAYAEKFNSKIIFIYWPEINKNKELSELKKRGFFNINGDYSMLKHTIKNNYCLPTDSHLSVSGMKHIAKELHNFIYVK